MEHAAQLEIAFAMEGDLHPLYKRALGALTLGADGIKNTIIRRTAVWCGIADTASLSPRLR